ncbi:hypothetical protein F5888DRAFT_861661 [Russula emetica]|nr:hypothetical protein F5888DRAFT_861661 [Russula emetica]
MITTLSQHRISRYKQNPTLVTALDSSSSSTPKLQRKKTIRWVSAGRKADRIFILTGLLSSAVATLLALTVQHLRPISQGTSAFYLGNVYDVLAYLNVTRTSSPIPVAKPALFSPPRYAIWLNSLWFLSLVMSLSCAVSMAWARACGEVSVV